MLRKIIILLITIFLLTSCSGKNTNHGQGNDAFDIFNPKQENEQEYKRNSLWSYEGDGNCTNDVNQKTINISSDNSALVSPEAVFHGGHDYTLSFDISADKNTTITLQVYDEQKEYLNQNINISTKETNNTFSFYCDNDSYSGKIKFVLDGNNGNTIRINNFLLDSDITKTFVKVNQVGYLSNLDKKIVMPSNQGDYFNVYNSNNELVYSGNLSEVKENGSSREYLQTGNFKNVKENGTYYIKTELGGRSKNFTINSNAYDVLAKDALHFIYTQRCGQAITREDSDEVYHEACHTNDTKVFTYIADTYIDTVGGWHDASDFGRYVQTAGKTMADLFFTYLYAGKNNIDALNEARYGVEWLLKLQKDNGSVYNKITTKSFAGDILPENDDKQMFALWPWTLTTASFAGITGIAYKIYKDQDSEFASRCLEAHQKALKYIIENEEKEQELNPDDFSTGEYSEPNESDERLFAYSVAYDISEDYGCYMMCYKTIDDGLASDDKNYNCRIYAIMTLLNCLDEGDPLYIKAYNSLIKECDKFCAEADVYSYVYDCFNWGSNSHLCDACNKLIFAYELTNDEKYLNQAAQSIDYVLGLNCLDICFVYGYGFLNPSHIHHRVANIRGKLPTGAMAGGVDQIMSDGIVGGYISEDTPRARRFVDRDDSFTNVEPAIYYNSALVLTLNLLNNINQKVS